jgi:catechol-2,3-dioxygenase
VPRIAEVALFTDDVAGVTAFYERLLAQPPNSRSDSHASFDLDGTTLFIHVRTGDAAHGAPDVDHVAIALDQDAAAGRARSLGAEVVGPSDFYWGRSAYVSDPDGRVIEIQGD